MIDNYIGKHCYRCTGEDLVLDYRAGDIICRNCGEIVSDRFIDESNESINYGDDRAVARSSGMSEGIGGMQTMFVNGPDHIRKALEKAQHLSSDKKETTVIGNLGSLNEMCSKLNLSRTIQDLAIDMFGKVVTQAIVVSRSKDPVIASCLYLACRLQGYPRTIEEVSKYTGICSSTLSKMQNVIARALSLPVGQAQVTPESLVNRVTAQLLLSHTIATHTSHMCSSITKYELFSTSPQSVVGGALLWVCLLSGVSLDIQDLSCTTLVTTQLLKNTFSKIHSGLAAVLPVELRARWADVWKSIPDSYDKAVHWVEQRKENALVKPQPPLCISTPSSCVSDDTCMSTATSTDSICSLAVNRSLSSSNNKRRGESLNSRALIEKHGSIFIPKKRRKY